METIVNLNAVYFLELNFFNINYYPPTNSPLEKPALPVGRGVRGIDVDNQMFTMKNTCLAGRWGDLNP